MQFGHQLASSNSFLIVLQPRHPILLDAVQSILVQAIINPKRGMEEPVQPQAPQPPNICGSPGKSCFDTGLAVFLVTLAGAVILLLLYKLLQLRHRLRLARARHALEYYSFYHSATYTLKHPEPPTKNGVTSEATPPVLTMATVTSVDVTPLPPSHVSSPPTLPLPSLPALPPPAILPPPPVHPPPSLPPPPPVFALPLPVPVIHTTPPSPHLSLGACSDADVYSRIGAVRPSRLSNLSSHSTVILFEHSSL